MLPIPDIPEIDEHWINDFLDSLDQEWVRDFIAVARWDFSSGKVLFQCASQLRLRIDDLLDSANRRTSALLLKETAECTESFRQLLLWMGKPNVPADVDRVLTGCYELLCHNAIFAEGWLKNAKVPDCAQRAQQSLVDIRVA